MQSFHRLALGAAIACGLLGSSVAALVERDLNVTGDNALTADSASGLEWLDVSATVGLSLAAVQSSPFVSQLGFRFAHAAEVETLWRNAGAGGPFQYDPAIESYAANFGAARSLVSLLGCTSNVLGEQCDGIGQNWHIGRYAAQASAAAPFVEDLALVDYFGAPDYRSGTGAMLLDWGSLDPAFFARADVGNYLVRSVGEVPEPSSAALALSALALLAAFRRRVTRDGERGGVGRGDLT